MVRTYFPMNFNSWFAVPIAALVMPCKESSYSFLPSKTNQLVKFNREVCSVYGNCTSIQIIPQWCEHTSLWISTADLFWGVKKTNNLTHLARQDYKQWQLPFQYCVLCIFIKRSLHNFYSVARNSKIISPTISRCSVYKMLREKIGKLTFETTIVSLYFFLKCSSH